MSANFVEVDATSFLKDLSRKLIEQRLCASAHNFAPVQSIYRWRGEIYERTEGRVSLHTRRDRVAEIVAVAKKEHPYEVPGISTRTITDGNPPNASLILGNAMLSSETRFFFPSRSNPTLRLCSASVRAASAM